LNNDVMEEQVVAEKFERLLSPGNIGTMSLRNRIILPPMVRNYATPNGLVTRQTIDHYASISRGGVGLIIVEATFVHLGGRGWHQQLGIHHDKCTPGLASLTEAVHDWGGKIAVQIHHAGRQTSSAITGMPVVAPSPVPSPGLDMPRELTLAECAELVESFGQAARRARLAGFDAVEIHAAHGYLISQFLSPNTNRRTDKYGGDINGRMTFLLETVQRVKQLAGNDYPIVVRINGEDRVENGIKIDESKQVAKALEAAGVNAIHVTVGTYESGFNPRVVGTSATMFSPKGHMVPVAAQIKGVVNIPVIALGSLTPELAEDVLKQSKADFIGMARQLLADAELPDKLRKGQVDEIRPCIRCLEFCRARMLLGVRCSVNAEVGSEGNRITPASKIKKVLVIGGGPAGMEAARVAAIRGHDVTLYEKDSKLGGHLIEGTVPDFKEDLMKYRDWLVGRMKKVGVKVKLGQEATKETVRNLKPDAVVMATGSSALHPNIHGINKPGVVTGIDILLGKAAAGKKTIVAGGGAVGCEVALYLAKQGKKVAVVEMLPGIVMDVPATRGILTTLLADNGVEVLTNLRITEITDSGVTCVNKDRETVKVNGDGVVLALGMKSEAGIYDTLKNEVSEIYQIGDSSKPGRVGEATRGGYIIGSAI
jgi:2,4-dienoyl-CoA reductase-like NADH-dependent reductase (Old Yellow Enzyme family)/thioredoxin reductase